MRRCRFPLSRFSAFGLTFCNCKCRQYMSLAEEQIKSAFAQSEKEVQDLHTRISQGMRESKRNGKQIGLEKGTILTTEKSIKCKEIIKKHATDFGGMLSDKEVMTLCQISRNSYYKYKRELKAQ